MSAPALGLIHIKDHYFQTVSSLKPLGQSKPNFVWEVGKKVYINGTGLTTKMAAILIFGKILQKSSPTELIVI